jgi:precorrin-4 methylase
MLSKKPMSCRILSCVAAFLLVSVFANATGPGKLYVVGMGPAGPDLTAPRALRIVQEADVLLCSPRLPKRFEALGMKFDPEKMAFDPWEGILGKKAQALKKADYEAWKAQARRQVEKVQDFVLERLQQGKTVAMMDGGDPCVYGPSLSLLLKGFDENLYEVIPGMGAVNAASAALKRSLISEDVRFAVLTSPRSLFGEEWEKGDEVLRDLSKYETTMVLYMSLSSLDRTAAVFKKYYPPDLPVAVVYNAGFAEKEKVLKSDLDHIVEDVKSVDEKWLGLVIVGKCAE